MNLAETRSHVPLVNKPKAKKAKRPIPKVTKKRASKNREYSKLRKEFLLAHPFCQVWLHQNGFDEADILSCKIDFMFTAGWHISKTLCAVRGCNIPLATEIHHKRKPKCKYLNDTSTWLAVCRDSHEWIESNKSVARERGYLDY